MKKAIELFDLEGGNVLRYALAKPGHFLHSLHEHYLCPATRDLRKR